jgi:hypothetical protein
MLCRMHAPISPWIDRNGFIILISDSRSAHAMHEVFYTSPVAACTCQLPPQHIYPTLLHPLIPNHI